MKRKTVATSKQKTATRAKNRRRGRRNRQRGAELQRLAVSMAKEFGLEAFNRDRGGAQHEKGDVEIEGLYYGCKRKKVIPSWVMPEKEEIGVIFRADRMEPYISIPLDRYLILMAALKI
mgnify:CR=1 FL=1